MTKIRKPAILLLALLGSAAAAHAGKFIETPLFAPIPTERPAAGEIATEAVANHVRRPVVRISVEPQPIPPSRLNVRVVGARFLPDESDGVIRRDDAPAGPAVVTALETELAR